jgi:hypothetical protein
MTAGRRFSASTLNLNSLNAFSVNEKPKKPTVYPVFKNLRAELNKLPAHPVLDMIAETVAEYEHGTANVEDVEGVTLKQYAAVALDLALVISAQS